MPPKVLSTSTERHSQRIYGRHFDNRSANTIRRCLPLNNILESAVILNWAAFGLPSEGGMVRIEYHVGAELSIEYLKIWSANSRGYLSLVCDYVVAAIVPTGREPALTMASTRAISATSSTDHDEPEPVLA